MNKNQTLTVDGLATKERLRKDGRTVAAYGRSRGFTETSMANILAGRFPFNDKPNSVYQRALQVLEKDGYLVEAGHTHLDPVQEHQAA